MYSYRNIYIYTSYEVIRPYNYLRFYFLGYFRDYQYYKMVFFMIRRIFMDCYIFTNELNSFAYFFLS